jgi:hypothetical protein
MTNAERRADDLRQQHLREQDPDAVIEPWRTIGAAQQRFWLSKSRQVSPNGTAALAPSKRSGFTPASPEQRASVKDQQCVVLKEDDPCDGPIDPAHLVDRALGGDDAPEGVVPLCRHHHDQYDRQGLSLLEFLEPRYREETAYAVKLVGMLNALQQITGERWEPESTGGLRVDPVILAYAARYALGRQSYAVGDVTDALIANADQMPAHLAAAVCEQIERAIAEGAAGAPSDAQRWQMVAERLRSIHGSEEAADAA